MKSLFYCNFIYTQKIIIFLNLYKKKTRIKMRSAFFWVITQRVVVIPYRRFRTNCQPPLQGPKKKSLEDGADTLSRNVGKELPLLAAQ